VKTAGVEISRGSFSTPREKEENALKNEKKGERILVKQYIQITSYNLSSGKYSSIYFKQISYLVPLRARHISRKSNSSPWKISFGVNFE